MGMFRRVKPQRHTHTSRSGHPETTRPLAAREGMAPDDARCERDEMDGPMIQTTPEPVSIDSTRPRSR